MRTFLAHKSVVQGIIFSMPRIIATWRRRNPIVIRRRRYGFRLGIHQVYKEMCQYSENYGNPAQGKMVAQPSIAQGVRFNIQDVLYPEPSNNLGFRIRYILYSSDL